MNGEKIDWNYDEQDDERFEKKSHKWIKPVLIIILLTFFLMFGVLYYMRSVAATRYVDSRNSEAKSCINSMNYYFETLEKDEGFKISTDKEYIITGYTDKTGMYIDPCELFTEGGTNSYWSHSKLFWAVRVKNGQAFEAWTYKDPITEDMMKHYNAHEQVEQRRKHMFSDKVIGYYNTDEGDGFFH